MLGFLVAAASPKRIPILPEEPFLVIQPRLFEELSGEAID